MLPNKALEDSTCPLWTGAGVIVFVVMEMEKWIKKSTAIKSRHCLSDDFLLLVTLIFLALYFPFSSNN